MNHITKKILSVIVTAVMVAGCNTQDSVCSEEFRSGLGLEQVVL
jgi:uncharacterized lipoprotein YajG